MSDEQISEQYHNIKTCNKSFESVEHFRQLGATVSNQNSIHEEIRADWSQEMLALVQCRIYCLPVCYTKP